MKKKILSLMLIMASLVACANKNEINTLDQKADTNENQVVDKKTITVTTTFIEDMVNELIEDKAKINLIIPAGEDPHLYVAKPEDLKKLKEADLILYHGLHFEGKMVDALDKIGFPITDTFDKKDIGQMQENGETIIDPHFWFDIDLYKEAFRNTSNKLKDLYKDDKEVMDLIEKNTDRYLKELDELDTYVVNRLNELDKDKRYLITPHDAFNYFSRKYEIEVMAPQGVSTDSEVSNKDLEDTASFIADKKIKAIFSESTTNPERMQKLKDLVESKGFETKVVTGEANELYSDSLSVKGGEAYTYIKMYKHNIDLIVDNLR